MVSQASEVVFRRATEEADSIEVAVVRRSVVTEEAGLIAVAAVPVAVVRSAVAEVAVVSNRSSDLATHTTNYDGIFGRSKERISATDFVFVVYGIIQSFDQR